VKIGVSRHEPWQITERLGKINIETLGLILSCALSATTTRPRVFSFGVSLRPFARGSAKNERLKSRDNQAAATVYKTGVGGQAFRQRDAKGVPEDY
jgi:hypothetical protein